MTLQEIEILLQLAGNISVGILIGGSIVYLLLKFLLPSYLSEKGKNLATKEDIESITEKVESVKTDYAKVLEEIRSDNQQKLAAIDREKNIKKEVYLGAVEAITRSQNNIASFANLNINEETITTSMTNDAGVIAKIQIVGTENTVKAVTSFMAAIGSATLELMLDRGKLIERKGDIEFLEKMSNKAQKEIDHYIEIMKNLNLEGNQDQRLWDTINGNVDFEQKQNEKYRSEIDTLWMIQNKDHFEFARKCMGCFFKISELLPEAVLSVRKELELSISSEAYLDIYNKNIEEGKLVFEKFLSNIEANE